jgi:signal transduction histidine kinase
LWDASLTLPQPGPPRADDRKIRFQDIPGPTGQTLRSAAQVIQIAGVRQPVQVLAASDVGSTRASVSRFRLMAGLAGALVAAGLMLVLFVQAAYGLRPLRHLARALELLRRGESRRLDADRFPREIRPLAEEHNALLAHHERMVERARGAAGDLAHGLKTPLSVLLAAAERGDPDLGAVVARQVARMKTGIDRQLALATVAGTRSRTPLGAVADDLGAMLSSAYAERRLVFHSTIDPRLRFHGSREDLEDMLGNLIDNACKWAHGRVGLGATLSGDTVTIAVEDDGPGIAEEELPHALERGVRLDERAPGHGLGLSIVSTLAASYGGTLTLQRCTPTGLRATLALPGSLAS